MNISAGWDKACVFKWLAIHILSEEWNRRSDLWSSVARVLGLDKQEEAKMRLKRDQD